MLQDSLDTGLLRYDQEIEVLTFMQGQTKQRWESLCEQAAKEQDPQRLMELVKEISRLLDEKIERVTQHAGNAA